MRKFILKTFTTVFAVFLCNFSIAQNLNENSWPQFRGNLRNGTAALNGQNINWEQLNPKTLWKFDLGEGFSEVVVQGERCFTMYGSNTDSISGNEYVTVIDIASGEKLWTKLIDTIFIDVDGWGNGPRSTPVLDHENIYGLTGSGKLFAMSQSNGSIVWERNLRKDFGSSTPRWGYSASPALVEGKLVVEVGGKENKAFAAFNPKDGSEIWAFGRGAAAYCSPIHISIEGEKQTIFANGRYLYSFNTNGDTLWTYKMPMNAPTAIPMFIEPNKLFLSAVNSTGALMLQIDNKKVAEVYKSPAMKNHWSSSIYYDEHIYGFSVAALRCISAADGSVKWSKRGLGKGSLTLVDGNLVILTDKGKIVIAEANPAKYNEISGFEAIEGRSWTAPTFVNGHLLVRNHSQIACFDLSKNQL